MTDIIELLNQFRKDFIVWLYNEQTEDSKITFSEIKSCDVTCGESLGLYDDEELALSSVGVCSP